MAHLGEVYAKDLGTKIGYPEFYPHYFPILYDKYITIHNGNKVPSKEYSYWSDVVKIIRPSLDAEDIKIFQIGTPDENKIENIDLHINTNTLKQAAFLIQNSQLHVGIDSVPVHIASALDIPSVSIYAHTYKNTCDPLWNRRSQSICIESNRKGCKPTFSLQESPKSIDLIMPETIAESILKQLNITPKTLPKTLYIGCHYNNKCIDAILAKPITTALPNNSAIRLDLLHNESYLWETLACQSQQIVLKLNKPVDFDKLLRFKSKIAALVYLSDSFDKNFIRRLKTSGIPTTLICTEIKNLKKERLDFLDYEINHFSEKDFIADRKKKINQKITKKLKYHSHKLYVVGDETASNLIDAKQKSGLSHKNDDFFVDSDHMMIYTLENYKR